MLKNSIEKKYNELLSTQHAYQSALNEAAIVSITDLNGTIIYVNEKFVEVSGYTANELIGQNHRIINSGYHRADYFKQLWKTIASGKVWRGEIKNKAKDGNFYWVDTVITPVLNIENKVYQYLSIRNLITTQKEHEEKLVQFQQELIKREQQLNDAQQVSKTGSWYLDLAHNSLEWSEETYRIFEIPAGTPMTYESFLERVHPDDRGQVDHTWRKALKGAPYVIEHRIVTPHGEKWLRETARLEFDEAKHLKRGVGTTQDITQQKESESLYKNLFNNSPFPNGILDKETFQFLEVNETAAKVYGYSKEEFLHLTGFDIRVPEEHEELQRQLHGNYAWDQSLRTHRKKNGELMLIEPYITEIAYKGKVCYLITIHDVTEKIRLQEQLIKSKLDHQKEINRASIEAQEKNRAEIGRELHDNVNQLLVSSNLYLKTIKPATEADQSSLNKVMEINIAAINEIRKLSHSLVPPSLGDLGLKEAIEELILYFAITSTTIENDLQIIEDQLSDGLKISIYRIIQEQFNNIIKYAEATRVIVKARQTNTSLSLEIIDNGKGFDMKQKPKGIGLTNIIFRAETYNGKVTIESSPGNGCSLLIDFTL
jgi:PAS domain S-box-containing protein